MFFLFVSRFKQKTQPKPTLRGPFYYGAAKLQCFPPLKNTPKADFTGMSQEKISKKENSESIGRGGKNEH